MSLNQTEDKLTQEEDGAAVQETQEQEETQIVPPFDETVRVLLMTEGFQGIYHAELIVSCGEGIYVDADGKRAEYDSDFEYTVMRGQLSDNGCIRISGRNGGRLQIRGLDRNGGGTYRGSLECYGTADGIVAVNELSVEEYLYGVLPSEMPSGYPMEALKAQAVCARSYTYFHKQSYAYPQWRAHMDDSTAFQVYMNTGETEAACRAVDETKNIVLTYQGGLAESFYYSTSSGFNGGAGVWKDTASASDGYLVETGEDIFAEGGNDGEAAYQAYIDSGNPEDAEYNEPWYRWQYDKALNGGSVRAFFEKLYALSLAQPQNVKIRSKYLSSDRLAGEQGIRDIRVLERKKSGLVTKLMIETENFRVSVSTQYTIRQAFGCAGDSVVRKDGSGYVMGDTLPSAYFYIEKIYNNDGNGDTLEQITIHGGGFGHGCGLSQNGAKCLAEEGFTAAQILAYYYNGSMRDVTELMAEGF